MTELFKKQVQAKLLANEVFNLEHKLQKEDDDYRIASHADLADATGADPNLIKNMFGGVRPGTKTKKIGKSKYVPVIRELLGLVQMTTVEVRADRARAHERLTALSDDEFRKYDQDLQELEQKSSRS